MIEMTKTPNAANAETARPMVSGGAPGCARPSSIEIDPNGLQPSDPGAKLDQGKNRLGLVLFGFARALEEVGKVGTYGANKYSDNGWMQVADGERRYTDAMFRHLMKEAKGEDTDQDTGFFHAAHAAWNALARLDLMIKNREGAQHD